MSKLLSMEIFPELHLYSRHFRAGIAIQMTEKLRLAIASEKNLMGLEIYRGKEMHRDEPSGLENT